MPLDGMLAQTASGVRSPSKFLPFFDHVAPDVVMLRDGRVMAMLRMEGAPFHLTDNVGRNGANARHYGLLQLVGDGETEVVEHYVSHHYVEPFDGGGGGSDYEREFAARYGQRVTGSLRRREWFMSIVVSPRRQVEGIVRSTIRKLRHEDPVSDDIALRELEAKVRTAKAALARYGAVRLGTRESGGFLYSEIGEALIFLRTLRREAVPLAHPAGAFGEALYADPVRHGRRGFVVLRDGGDTSATVGRMIGLQVYPKIVRVGMFDALLMADVDMVMTNTAKTLQRGKATDQLELILSRMRSADARAIEDAEELEEALGELASGQEVRAEHNWSIAVHAPDMATLDDHVAQVTDLVSGGGCKPSAYGLVGGEAAYWAQWPGNLRFRPRPATVGLRRFTMLSSLDGFPQGRVDRHYWDKPLLRLATAGGTPFDLSLHHGQIGNALFVGPIGSGKTLAMGAFITSATRLVGENGRIFVWDKDSSNALTIRANGGSYTTLRRGEASGAAPLRRLDNTLADATFAGDFVVSLIAADGGASVPPAVRARIAKGVAWVMRLPPEQRSLGAIHAFLPPADPSNAADRLRPWCAGEERGWAFDGDTDTIDFDARMAGVDVTALLDDDTVLAPMISYLLHSLRKRLDGRRTVLVAEEARFLLLKPYIASMFEDLALTGRKKNVALWLVTQQPEHILSHPMGSSLLSQIPTRFLFRNERADRAAYCGGGRFGDGMHCTPQEFQQVREGMAVGPWSVLVQRPNFSTVCRFDLGCMPEDVAVLSGNPRTVRLWDRIAAEYGTTDPTVIKPLFLNRLQEARA